VIAVWPTAGCLGTGTYQQYRVAGGALSADCLDITSSLASEAAVYGFIQIGISSGGSAPWQVRQYSSMSDCTSRSLNNYFTRAVSGPSDASCYNFDSGSFSLYMPGQSAAPAAGSTVAYPPMHAAQYAGSPVATAANQVALAMWFGTTCTSGSAGATVATQGNCYNYPGVPDGANLFSYTLTCTSKSASSAWTFTDYVLPGCQAGNAASPKQGTGPACVRCSQSGRSVYIDCAAQTAGLFVNDLPLTDGGWNSTYGECVGACGGATGTQTRTCTAPAPSGGGADCAGEASRTCTTDACSGGSASSSSSSGATDPDSSSTAPVAPQTSSTGSESAPGDNNSADSSLSCFGLVAGLAIGGAAASAAMGF